MVKGLLEEWFDINLEIYKRYNKFPRLAFHVWLGVFWFTLVLLGSILILAFMIYVLRREPGKSTLYDRFEAWGDKKFGNLDRIVIERELRWEDKYL